MILDIILIIISIILIGLIIVQQRGTMGGGVLGGDTEFFLKRRGWENLIFKITWIVLFIFILLSIIKII